MERRSFLKAVGTAGLVATVIPAWSIDDVANRQSLQLPVLHALR